MNRPVKLLLAAVLFLVLAVAVVFLIARMRPLAMYAASGRRALLSAGLAKAACCDRSSRNGLSIDQPGSAL